MANNDKPTLTVNTYRCPLTIFPADTCSFYAHGSCCFGEGCTKVHAIEGMDTQVILRNLMEGNLDNLPPSIRERAVAEHGMLHPCVSANGDCDYDKKCTFSRFYRDVCLAFVKGKCTSKDCKYRHDETPAEYAERRGDRYVDANFANMVMQVYEGNRKKGAEVLGLLMSHRLTTLTREQVSSIRRLNEQFPLYDVVAIAQWLLIKRATEKSVREFLACLGTNHLPQKKEGPGLPSKDDMEREMILLFQELKKTLTPSIDYETFKACREKAAALDVKKEEKYLNAYKSFSAARNTAKANRLNVEGKALELKSRNWRRLAALVLEIFREGKQGRRRGDRNRVGQGFYIYSMLDLHGLEANEVEEVLFRRLQLCREKKLPFLIVLTGASAYTSGKQSTFYPIVSTLLQNASGSPLEPLLSGSSVEDKEGYFLVRLK